MSSVSVVIPFFQRQQELETLLESLGRMDLFGISLDVTVVQDGSPVKNPQELTARFSKLNLRFLENPENRGPGFSRAHGARFSRGEYLWFLDSDAIVRSPGVLKAMIAALEEDTSRIAAGGIIETSGTEDMILRAVTLPGYYFMLEMHPNLPGHEADVPFLSLTSLLISRERFNANEGFDVNLRMHEDNDFCIRLQKKFGGHFYQSYETMVFHACSPSGREQGFFDYFKSRYRFLGMKFEARNLLMKRYDPWQLLLLPVADMISVSILLVRGGRYKMRLDGVRKVKRWQAWVGDGFTVVKYMFLGVLLFFKAPIPRRAFEDSALDKPKKHELHAS
jgi:GT2 family glycosyltransferase